MLENEKEVSKTGEGTTSRCWTTDLDTKENAYVTPNTYDIGRSELHNRSTYINSPLCTLLLISHLYKHNRRFFFFSSIFNYYKKAEKKEREQLQVK